MAYETVVLAQNYFSDIAFPTHTITAEEEATGHEAWRVADGRRSAFDYWSPTTVNSETWIKTNTGVAGGIADVDLIVALDRGHNLAGLASLKFQLSANDADWTDLWTVTIPGSASSGTSVDAANGCTTEEGAWIKRANPVASYRYARLLIPLMGAGVVPKVVGLYFGPAYSLGQLFLPVTDQDKVPSYSERETDSGWVGTTPVVLRGEGELVLKLDNEAAYVTAKTHLVDHFAKRRPMWIVHDDAYAERAVLAMPRKERWGFRVSPDWAPGGYIAREATIPWVEHEPKRP